ncbi:MAG: PAS domain S-box protein [Methanoregula sp.]|jgi:PAS domain S-box-containing protein|nr:PAS domain S-box protein [Methanoregula sp.]
MKLQEKTSLILIFLLIFSISIISILVTALSLSSYSALEIDYTDRQVSMAVNTLTEESQTISALAGDWGSWDDTWNFVNGDKPDYLRTNLLPETFGNIRMNLIIIADTNGDIVYARAYDTTNRTMVMAPDSIVDQIRPGTPLMYMSNPHGGTEGMLVLPEGVMIVASRPITRSDYSGTPRGVIIMGRYLDSVETARLAQLTSPSLLFTRVDDPALPSDLIATLAGKPGLSSRGIKVLGKDKIGGYALIRDIYGNDALVLQIVQYRDIFQQGVTTTLNYILVVLAAGLFLGVAVLFILDRLVLSRIMELIAQVSGIGNRTDISERISLSGNDEFADLAGVINQMLGTMEKTRKGLLASEGRFRELAELLPQIIFEIDLSGRILYLNRAGTEIFSVNNQKKQDELTLRSFLIPGDFERLDRMLTRTPDGIKTPGDIYSFRLPGEILMRALICIAPIHRDGAVTGFRGIITDISERVDLEEALIESQEYLQSLLWSVRVGIVVIDEETHHIVDANPAALEMIGATKDQIIGRTCNNFICSSESGKCPITDLHHQVNDAESTILTFDGREIPVIKYVIPVMLQGRSCILETFIDNTARKQIEHELRESRERLSGILHASPVGVFETGNDGMLTYVNERWEELTGLTLDAMKGIRWTEILHPLDKVRVAQEIKQKIQINQMPRAETRFIRSDGAIIWFYCQAVPLYNPGGEIRGYAGTITDITERKRDEDAVQLANKKLNLMNNITRHDILNTITGLFGLVDMAVATGNEDERIQLLTQIKELGRVIQRQITFTKEYQDVGIRAPCWQNIRDIVNRAFGNFCRPDVSFIVDIENTEVFADPLLEKVFYNLVDNAIRYGEHVSVIRFYYEVSDRGISLICEDNGEGIPYKSKDEIFERGVGRNTGMGLFLTREILMITDIRIREIGIPGHGARFEILIPNGTWRFVKEQ